MALVTVNLSGFISLPDGTDPEGAVLFARLNKPDYDEASNEVIPFFEVNAAVGSGGSVSIDLWPNSRGSVGSHYAFRVAWRNANGVFVECQLAATQIPEIGAPHDIADIMALGTGQFDGIVISTLSTAESADLVQFMEDYNSGTPIFDGMIVQGNAVIGTSTPWTFASSWRGVKLTDRHAIQATSAAASISISSNAAIGASGWEYTTAGTAGKYNQSGGLHIFERAASGTDGDPVSWVESFRIDNNGDLLPGADNAQDLGSAALRMNTIYAGTGAINTSDERMKEQITGLTDAEARVAIAAKGLLKKFKFKDAVAEKGEGARWHFGIVAQELKAAFEAEGLDPFAYGVLCWDEWSEGAEDDANAARHDCYGIRYDELLAFVLVSI